MKKKKIFLCASMNFYKELVEVEKQLTSRGFVVDIPVSAKVMKKKNDFEVSHFKGVYTPREKAEFIKENFENIRKSDAVLVINNEKNGVKGYIGTNVLMEIGLAYFFKKKIFLWNPIPADASYREELLAFEVTSIEKNLDTIKF
jgi:nucleoside 2-deoxyribosyltransferase